MKFVVTLVATVFKKSQQFLTFKKCFWRKYAMMHTNLTMSDKHTVSYKLYIRFCKQHSVHAYKEGVVHVMSVNQYVAVILSDSCALSRGCFSSLLGSLLVAMDTTDVSMLLIAFLLKYRGAIIP